MARCFQSDQQFLRCLTAVLIEVIFGVCVLFKIGVGWRVIRHEVGALNLPHEIGREESGDLLRKRVAIIQLNITG